MMRWGIAGSSLLIGLACCGQAQAARCSGVDPATVVWCDDFDSYCDGGSEWLGYPTFSGGAWQPFPEACPAGSNPDQEAFRSEWVQDDLGLPELEGDAHAIGQYAHSSQNLPFAVRFPGAGTTAARHTHDFSDAIQYRATVNGQPANGVNGTDANPLIFDLFLNFDPNAVGKEANAMYYVELAWGDDRAPTDYVLKACTPGENPTERVPAGHPAGSNLGPYPIINQQWLNSQIVVPHPPLKTDIRASLAFGALAAIDREPCNLETGWRPSNYHICLFDGLKWWDLRQSLFTPGTGDFGVKGKLLHFRVEIKSTTMRFIYWGPNGAIDSYATIPRQYTGPFNTIGEGPGKGCELDPSTGECVGPYKAFDWGVPEYNNDGWTNAYMDTPVLYGGVLEFVDMNGACCLPNATCSQMLHADCQAAGGAFAGAGVACEQIECCPNPPFDRDTDGDVDSADFGALQRCLTIGTSTPALLSSECKCFDTDSNGAIDVTDIERFAQCGSGPDVPSNPACVTW